MTAPNPTKVPPTNLSAPEVSVPFPVVAELELVIGVALATAEFVEVEGLADADEAAEEETVACPSPPAFPLMASWTVELKFPVIPFNWNLEEKAMAAGFPSEPVLVDSKRMKLRGGGGARRGGGSGSVAYSRCISPSQLQTFQRSAFSIQNPFIRLHQCTPLNLSFGFTHYSSELGPTVLSIL